MNSPDNSFIIDFCLIIINQLRMALVSESQRFANPSDASQTPGPGQYKLDHYKKESFNIQKKDPSFLSNVPRDLPLLRMHEIAAPPSLRSPNANPAPLLNSSTERFPAKNSDVPGPGQYINKRVFDRVYEKEKLERIKKGFRFSEAPSNREEKERFAETIVNSSTDSIGNKKRTNPTEDFGPNKAGGRNPISIVEVSKINKSSLLSKEVSRDYSKGVNRVL